MCISQSASRILALSSVKGCGVKTFHHLLEYLGSIDAIWKSSYEQLLGIGLRSSIARGICSAIETHEKKPASSVIAGIESWLEGDERYFLGIEDAGYPSDLKQIYGAPPFLFVEGQLESLSQRSIAIVGSRNASASGLQNAFSFARDLSSNDCAVTSGLALGVDAAAHKGALDVGGTTLAVLATGLDLIYPKKHGKLAEELKEKGALVSEMHLGTMPIPANFPRRNRIVSGLSRAVLVVEAGLKSGSLITARFALEQNRDVYAIPGSIHNPMAKGCHSLIKQGGALVEDVSDILDDLAVPDNKPPKERGCRTEVLAELSDLERKVVEHIGYDRQSFDALITGLSMDIACLTETLMSLELKGVLSTVPGGYQRI